MVTPLCPRYSAGYNLILNSQYIFRSSAQILYKISSLPRSPPRLTERKFQFNLISNLTHSQTSTPPTHTMTSQVPTSNVNSWCLPLHHTPSGPTNPKRVSLPSPFVVLVAGASRGIGAGIARAYAQAGASGIILASRKSDALIRTRKDVLSVSTRGDIVQVEAWVCDVTDDKAVQELAERTKSTFGRLDVLVINAGRATALERNESGLLDWPKTVVDHTVPEFNGVLGLNLLAPFSLLHHFLPLLEETKDGPQSVIQLSSAASHYVDYKNMTLAYSLSKFAVTRLIEHVADAHGEKGICAYAVQPGGVKTEMQEIPEGKGWEDSEFCRLFENDRRALTLDRIDRRP
jgi:NAD(P)-dependent dehydrogenase (short-subunit alcohol dehydrogenase family)